MKECVAWALVIVGFVGLGVVTFEQQVFRFQHETLTETQLSLRFLRVGLIPFLVCLATIGTGALFVWRTRK